MQFCVQGFMDKTRQINHLIIVTEKLKSSLRMVIYRFGGHYINDHLFINLEHLSQTKHIAIGFFIHLFYIPKQQITNYKQNRSVVNSLN